METMGYAARNQRIMIDVVIPARNESATIGPIVAAFRANRRIGIVYVVIDNATKDDTLRVAVENGAHVIWGPPCHANDKGQNVVIGLRHVTTRQVILCDADYTGLSYWHVSRLCQYSRVPLQIIGEPDVPDNYPPSKRWAWPWVSGIRRVPTVLAQSVPLHGYLMEVQLNHACQVTGVPTMFTRLRGLSSPYRMTPQRLAERDRDFAWGRANGILPAVSGTDTPPEGTTRKTFPRF